MLMLTQLGLIDNLLGGKRFHVSFDICLCQTLFFGAPKSLQMVIVAMKLKDTYSLEGKL